MDKKTLQRIIEGQQDIIDRQKRQLADADMSLKWLDDEVKKMRQQRDDNNLNRASEENRIVNVQRSLVITQVELEAANDRVAKLEEQKASGWPL